MSLDWPPTGTSILLDILGEGADIAFGTQASRVQSIDDRGLTILPPLLTRPPTTDLTGAGVIVRWQDPDNGTSQVPGVLGPVRAGDRRAPWHVTITGEVSHNQRRRFVRELMPGSVTIVQPRVRTRAAGDAWTASAGLTLRGALVDLGEGGARLVTDQAPFLDLSTTVRTELSPAITDDAIVVTAEVLRIERTGDQWTLVVQFPEVYEQMRAVRAVVFAAMRDRRRIGVTGLPDGGTVPDAG